MNAVMFNKQYIFFSADNLDTSNKSKMFYYKYKKTDMETANYSYTLHVPNVIKQQSELTKLSSTYETSQTTYQLHKSAKNTASVILCRNTIQVLLV